MKTTKQIIEENQSTNNYEVVGVSLDPKEWVLSNSALNTLDPDRGGHPKELYKFMTEPRENTINTSLMTGTLLHKYMENKDIFGISEVIKPGEKLGIASDAIVETLSAVSSFEVSDELILAHVRNVGWNPKWGDEAILKNTRDVITPYVQEVLRNTGKHIVTKAVGETLNKAIESIVNNDTIQNLIYTTNEDTEIFTELELYGECKTNKFNYKTKGKLDRVHIDSKAKIIRIFDYKTTGGASSKFLYSFKSYKYYRQMAFYRNLVRDLFPDYIIKVYIITVETSGLFISSVHEISENWLSTGSEEIYNLLMLLDMNMQANNFNVTRTELVNYGINILPYDYEPSRLY